MNCVAQLRRCLDKDLTYHWPHTAMLPPLGCEVVELVEIGTDVVDFEIGEVVDDEMPEDVVVEVISVVVVEPEPPAQSAEMQNQARSTVSWTGTVWPTFRAE